MARLTSEAREAAIVDAAVAYFAEAGFDGTTRELARRIGVSQGLLFRYFPTKDALVDRVYEEVFDRSWRPEWDTILDGDGEVEERIVAFYADYARVILEPRWIRLFLLSGLRGYDIPARWVRMLRSRVFLRVTGLLRRDMGLPEGPPGDSEIEAVWGLHGSLVYIGIRRSIFMMRPQAPVDALVEQQVRMFVAGFRALFAASLTEAEAPPSLPRNDRATSTGHERAISTGNGETRCRSSASTTTRSAPSVSTKRGASTRR